MRLALADLYRPVWSETILSELAVSVVRRFPHLSEKQVDRSIDLMQQALPAAEVSGYESLIESLTLPDPSDRHVLAVAIVSDSEVIVTDNVSDFPPHAVAPHGIEVQTADEFVYDLISQDLATVAQVVTDQAASLRSPAISTARLLRTLRNSGLAQSTSLLRAVDPHKDLF